MSQTTNPIKLIVGLGNPGPQYEHTRHNAGAWYLETLARDYNVNLKIDAKFHGAFGRLQTSELDAWLLLPNTFMNLSGRAVFSLSHFYKIPLESVLVVHDELDLDPGIARLKFAGGHGGHNGLRDIIQKFGGKKTFHRLRLGVGHPGDRSEVHNWVLGKAKKIDQQKIDLAIEESLLVTRSIIKGDMSKAMNQLHQFRAS